ncbi:MAG: hypothetical protein DMG61_23335 [Acidobacteria bacterium]|nr:MAG: hypothetical protein DMG61_23335 [Acidobacteriota bacterium]
MFVQTLGRLKPHVSERELAAELATIASHFGVFGKQPRRNWQPRVLPLKDVLVGNVRKLLVVFAFAVGFVLLIACSNVANLLLARATRREVEIAVRSALGAGRGRLIRQLLVESMLMSLVGALGGIAFSWWGVSALLTLAPEGKIPREQLIHLDTRVLVFTIIVSIFASLLFGLAPALQATRGELRETLSHAGTSIAGQRQWLRSVLVVGEVAMALVLLAGTGLFLRTFLRLRSIDPGFHADNDVVMTINLPPRIYRTGQQMLAFHEQVLSRLASLPGVEIAAAVNSRPMGGIFVAGDFKLEDGRKLPEGYMADKLCVSQGYFRAMDIPIKRGRDFNTTDVGGTPSVVIVSDSVARRFWPNQDPIGKRITGIEHPKESDWRTIVGVVGDVHQKGLRKPADPAIYEAITQSEQEAWLIHMNFVVRAAQNPESLMAAMRAVVNETD